MFALKFHSSNLTCPPKPWRRRKSDSGFTLIEVVISMGIFSIISTMGYLVTMDFYKSYAFNSERDTIVSILQKARSQSLSNICLGGLCSAGQAHGVHFALDQYVIFQGPVYNQNSISNQPVTSATGITHSGITDVVFDQLSGNAHFAPAGNLNLTDGRRNEVISLNNEGQINW